MIDKADFSAWRDSPITEAVFKALELKAAEAKQAWLAASWGSGNVSEALLADLRATADTCRYVIELDHEELEMMLESERQRDIPDRIQDSGATEEGRGEK